MTEGGSVRNGTQEKLAAPFGTRESSLQSPENCSGEKAAKAAPLPPLSPFSIILSTLIFGFFLPHFYFSCFTWWKVSHPGCISTGKPGFSVAQQFWEASWRGAGAHKYFLGLTLCPKAIKAHKELSAQICFSTAKLGFSPQGEQGGREAIKLQVFSAHS